MLSQADVLSVLRFFHSQKPPQCLDAADFDDSGDIEVTDLINLVTFMYQKGLTYPANPYRVPGEDPTPDALGCSPRSTLVDAGQGGWAQELSQHQDNDEDDGQVIDFIEFFSRRVDGYPGETGIRVPILVSNMTEMDGFTICVSADPSKVWLENIEVARLMPGRHRPEYLPLHREQQVEGYLGRSIFMDYQPPFEGKTIPRNSAGQVAHLVFGLSPEAKPGERLRISFADIPQREEFRPSPFNEICVNGRSVRPFLDQEGLEVRVWPESKLFLRGDPNRDLVLNITDVIQVLRYLFLGHSLPCLDPADVDDSGKIDISDVIFLADYLFGEGKAPLAPFPNSGLDPSGDPLGECR